MSQNQNTVVMSKHNIIFILRLVQLFIKGRLTFLLQTFSSLLFSLSFSLCFSLCFSELLSLCFSFSLSLCFFSQRSLYSLEHRSHTGQVRRAPNARTKRCPRQKHQKINFTNIDTVRQNCQECPTVVALLTSCSPQVFHFTTQKENMSTVPQWFKLLMLCRCHS